MGITEDRGWEFEELPLVKYMIFQIEGMKIFDGKVYIESDLCTARCTLAHLENPEPAAHFKQIPEQ